MCVLGVEGSQHVHFVYSMVPKPTRLQLKIISYLLSSSRTHMHCAKPSQEEAARPSLHLSQLGLEIHPPLQFEVRLRSQGVLTRSSVSATVSMRSGIQLLGACSPVKPTKQPLGKQAGSGAHAHPARHRARTQTLAQGLHLYLHALNPRPRPLPLAHSQLSL